MLFLLVDEVLDTMVGTPAENRAPLYFLVLLEVLWMGGLYVFLTLSIKPSVHYGYFVERLHRGDRMVTWQSVPLVLLRVIWPQRLKTL